MIFIEKKLFLWRKVNAESFKNFFKIFFINEQPLFLKYGNVQFALERFTPSVISQYINVDFGAVGSSVEFNSAISCLSYMLHFFYHYHLRRDLIFYTQIQSDTIYLSDPIFRQKIRFNNYNCVNIQKKYFDSNGFNLKNFIKSCSKQFLHNKGWRWVGGNHFAHELTVRIILLCFEYGLWREEDLDWLLVNLYSISEVMFNLENHIDLEY